MPRLDLPRDAVAERLGLRGLQLHVPAVQLSRGKLEAAVVHALVQLGATANRLAADLVLFASAEFGFVTLPVEYTTGSSIMPQKRNPDVFELARATYHRLTAELHLLLSLPANLPSGYHRDLQLTKESVMRAVLTARDLFTALRHILPGVRFDAERDARAPSRPASSPPTPRSRSSSRASRSAKPTAAPPPRSTPSPCPTRPRPSRPIVLPARRATSAPTPSAPNSTRNAHDSTRRDPGLPAYTTPYARTASATLTKPPTFAPRM